MIVEGYTSSGRDAKAIKGIVLHRAGADRVVGTVHDVVEGAEGEEIFGPGQLLTHDHIRGLNELLNAQAYSRRIIPECLVVTAPDILVWWRPSQIRPVWFAAKSAIDDLNARYARWPALLFVGRPSGLAVFALAASQRPGPETELLRGPFYNIWASGTMCPGSAPLPMSLAPTVEIIDMFERAFYDSSFTHTNLGMADLTLYAGGHRALWQSMVDDVSQVFPFESLIPLDIDGQPLTLERMLQSYGPLKIHVRGTAVPTGDEAGAEAQVVQAA